MNDLCTLFWDRFLCGFVVAWVTLDHFVWPNLEHPLNMFAAVPIRSVH